MRYKGKPKQNVNDHLFQNDNKSEILKNYFSTFHIMRQRKYKQTVIIFL